MLSWLRELYASALDTPPHEFPRLAEGIVQALPAGLAAEHARVISEHLLEATRINALLLASEPASEALPVGRALATPQGFVVHSTCQLIDLLSLRRAGCGPHTLPRAWLSGRRRTVGIGGNRLEVVATRIGECWLVKVMPASPFARLTSRERVIACAFSAGGSYRQVAARTGLTAAIVRSGVQRVYKKLGICSKVQLAATLEAWQSPGTAA